MLFSAGTVAVTDLFWFCCCCDCSSGNAFLQIFHSEVTITVGIVDQNSEWRMTEQQNNSADLIGQVRYRAREKSRQNSC